MLWTINRLIPRVNGIIVCGVDLLSDAFASRHLTSIMAIRPILISAV
jgi:hypothetical protein